MPIDPNEVAAAGNGAAWLLWLFGAIAVAIIVVMVVRIVLHRKSRMSASLHEVVMLVTVPKELNEQEKQRERSSDPKEFIGSLETFMVNLGSVPASRHANVLKNSWDNFWYGRHDEMSFEIVVDKGLIKFYVVVPRYLQQLVEHQLHAQYPKAHIETVKDYNIFTSHGTIMGGYLRLTKRSMFPIRTYKKLDSDPLNALTNVLSKIDSPEGAAIQIVIRPAHKGWQRHGQHVADKLQHGKKMDEALGTTGVGGYLRSTAQVATSSMKTPGETAQDKRYTPPYLTPMAQELVKSLEEKASKPGFEVNIRIVTASPDRQRVRMNLLNLTNAFMQFRGQESENGFTRRRLIRKGAFLRGFIYRHFNSRNKFILNSEELTSLWHLPLPTKA